MRVVPFLCLAASKMPGGFCVAGKVKVGERGFRWIRAVPIGEGGWGKVGFGPLDVVDLPLVRRYPKEHQTENWLARDVHLLTPRRKVPVEKLELLVDDRGPLWVNGYHTFYGCNDRVPPDRIGECSDSLRLIKVERLLFFRLDSGRENTRPRIKVNFVYGGVVYKLPMTDPRWAYVEERREIGHCFLTISLGERYDDGCLYKLAAAVFPCGGAKSA